MCGCTTRTVAEATAARIVVGTIGVSPDVDAAIARGELDVGEVRKPAGDQATGSQGAPKSATGRR